MVWRAGISCLAVRSYLAFNLPFTLKTHFYATHIRIDSLAFGVLIAYFFHFQPEIFNKISHYKKTLLLVGGILILPAFFLEAESPYIYTMGFSTLYLGYGCILIATMGMTFPEVGLAKRLSETLAYIGSFSYSIYLWHLFFRGNILQILRAKLALNLNEGQVFTLYFFGSILFGILMGKLIEIPALKIRDRFFLAEAQSNLPSATLAVPAPT